MKAKLNVQKSEKGAQVEILKYQMNKKLSKFDRKVIA